jgi:hypothetical protein
MKTLTMMPDVGQARHGILQAGLLGNDVEPAFGGHFMAAFGHEHGHFGLEPKAMPTISSVAAISRLSLIWVSSRSLRTSVILDVAAILAQMHGDAVGTAKMGFHGSPRRVRLPGATGLAQGGHVVDVDAEFDQDGSPGKAKQFGKYPAGLELLPAEVVLDEPAHQRLALGQGFRVAKIAGGHVEQRFAGTDRRIVDAVFVQGTGPRSII